MFDESVTLTESETRITAMSLDDKIGLQGTRQFNVTVSLTTGNSTNTATVSVTDDESEFLSLSLSL